MSKGQISAKLFGGLAVASFAAGVALYKPGFPLFFYLNPVTLVMIPRLVPFSAGIMCATFGVIYWLVERNSYRPASVYLTIVQILLMLVAVFAFVKFSTVMLTLLNEENPSIQSFSPWSSVLFACASGASMAVFMFNIFRRRPLNP